MLQFVFFHYINTSDAFLHRDHTYTNPITGDANKEITRNTRKVLHTANGDGISVSVTHVVFLFGDFQFQIDTILNNVTFVFLTVI